ncbi:MAG: hypothetical protein JXQ71_01620 [Verrucomicrobia bacterium]|nr:hypothetical protein [Verrucomicrobiota bacterium]
MKVVCPNCGVTIILVMLEFQDGEVKPCKFKCPNCSASLEFHSDFAVHEGKPEPRLLADAAPAGLSGHARPAS